MAVRFTVPASPDAAKGGRYDAPTEGSHANYQTPNAWFRLAEHIRKDEPNFRKLSSNNLRKTGANSVRSEAGGEVAGVFLCHGVAVISRTRAMKRQGVKAGQIAEELGISTETVRRWAKRGDGATTAESKSPD